MGFTIEFDETWMAGDVKRSSSVLHVQPADSVIPDLWDAFDGNSTYRDTYSTDELVQIQSLGDVSVFNRFSGAPWSPSQVKSARKRERRKPGKRKVFAAYYAKAS